MLFQLRIKQTTEHHKKTSHQQHNTSPFTTCSICSLTYKMLLYEDMLHPDNNHNNIDNNGDKESLMGKI